MDAFQSYFEYEMFCGCGIPKITLLGTPDDWRSVRQRAAMFSEYGLSWWTDTLSPVLDQMVESSEGRVDTSFWRSFFRYQSGSGPAELTGWILTLFPYLEGEKGSTVQNPYLAAWERALRKAESRTDFRFVPEGPHLLQLRSSLASAPVKVIDVRDGSEHPLRFVGGMFGVIEDQHGAFAPEFGWAVVHERPVE